MLFLQISLQILCIFASTNGILIKGKLFENENWSHHLSSSNSSKQKKIKNEGKKRYEYRDITNFENHFKQQKIKKKCHKLREEEEYFAID